MNKKDAIKDLRTIKNIGAKVSEVLYLSGFRSAKEVLLKEPEEIWMQVEEHIGYEWIRKQSPWCAVYLQALWCGQHNLPFGYAPDDIKQRFNTFKQQMYGK